MGYNISATTTTLTAKLTPIGRRKFVISNNNLVTSFSLGDSDANYYAALPLTTGQVPSDSGNIGANGSLSNSVGPNVGIKSSLLVNSTGITKKATEPQSSDVTLDLMNNGIVTVSGSNISKNVVLRTNQNTDSLVNLYYSFGLPLDSNGDYNFTGLTSALGGFSNTALSGIAQTNILVIGINSANLGEVIDGKAIKAVLTTSAGTYTLYSTFQNTGLPLTVQDANINDTARNTSIFGTNIAMLFSDDIQTPNGGVGSLSWATGFNTVKPFTQNGKQLYNLTTDTNLSENADTAVGIAYLDKGFLVITNPTIVNNFNSLSGSVSVTLDSVSSLVVQNITCISNRGEFGSSTNPTFRLGDTPRISEIGLFDIDGDLIAIAKTDRHIIKNVNEFLALGIKIIV